MTFRRRLLLISILLFISSPALISAQSGTLTGTVKDTARAVIPGATIRLLSRANQLIRSVETDQSGGFKISGLPPDNYLLQISHPGFDPVEQVVSLESNGIINVSLVLQVVRITASTSVSSGNSPLANSDPLYRTLRDASITETYLVTDLQMARDVATFKFRKGRISFLTPVMNRSVVAVFVGEGEFILKPTYWLELNHIKLVTGAEVVQDTFKELFLIFSDETYSQVRKSFSKVEPLADDFNALKSFRKIVRAEGSDNAEAHILSNLLCTDCQPTFNARIKGEKYKQLNFIINSSGAVGDISPEEVALINDDFSSNDYGIWYLTHTQKELESATASSGEDKRRIDAINYKVDNIIDGEKLIAGCTLTFKPLHDGDRVIHLNLLSSLRVSRVMEEGRDLSFIQEDKDHDGSFHVIFPEPLKKDRQVKVVIEYQGKNVIKDAGGGNFSVTARSLWFPRAGKFDERATFDLTFRLHRKYTLVASGKLVSQSLDGDYSVTRWVSEHQVGVAGFNYGAFKKTELFDDQIKQMIEVHAVPVIPDTLRGLSQFSAISPSNLSAKALNETQNSLRIFTNWFGELPYGRVAITQQPQLNIGQSWPTLIYMPIVAFLDSTTRVDMFGLNSGLTYFVQELTPHEVAHQWWGHLVGWSNYRDQWISEGFAEFSAGLFLEYTRGGKLDDYHNFWARKSKKLLEKSRYGIRLNDVGPIAMGLRVGIPRAAGAYQNIVYDKGAYILHMLRFMMYDQQNGDRDFINMIKDFVNYHRHASATTESFKYFVDKHIKPNMDLDANKKMDWFFYQWLFGTEIPRYRMQYRMEKQADGKTLATLTLTQSDVSDGFRMIVPLYVDYNGKVSRVGEIPVAGNMTTSEYKITFPGSPKRLIINYHQDVLSSESVSQLK